MMPSTKSFIYGKDHELEGSGYERLLHAGGKEDENDLDVPPKQPRRSRILCLIKKTIIAALAVYGLINASLVVYQALPEKPVSCYCGRSLAEALSLGCKFDGVAGAILPPHCRDDKLTAEFDRSSSENPDGSWTYWADPHKKQRLNESELIFRFEPFYASQEWHIFHCTYNWRKKFRPQIPGVDGEDSSEDHVGHCEKIFKMRKPLHDIATVMSRHEEEAGESEYR